MLLFFYIHFSCFGDKRPRRRPLHSSILTVNRSKKNAAEKKERFLFVKEMVELASCHHASLATVVFNVKKLEDIKHILVFKLLRVLHETHLLEQTIEMSDEASTRWALDIGVHRKCANERLVDLWPKESLLILRKKTQLAMSSKPTLLFLLGRALIDLCGMIVNDVLVAENHL
jgi:hypothetical protein